jgi:hypothetical protein
MVLRHPSYPRGDPISAHDGAVGAIVRDEGFDARLSSEFNRAFEALYKRVRFLTYNDTADPREGS